MNNSDSKHQKRFNRYLKIIHTQQTHLETAKLYRQQASAFVDKLLDENRVTKEELAQYFKKRP